MRASVGGIWGGIVVAVWVTACGQTSDPGTEPGAAGSVGTAGAAALASAGSNAGAAGNDDAAAGAAGDHGPGGEAGADSGVAGSGGNLNAGGNLGMSGNLGASGNPGSVGLGGYPPIDIGAQQTSDKLDVLFVVDNSSSMTDKQNLLKVSVPRFIKRLVNPLCVDAQGQPVATQPTTGAAACSSGTRELTPVTNLHVGVITSSLGSHGGSVCATAQTPNDHPDDHAELLPTQRANLPSYNNAGYLAYDANGEVGVANVDSVITDLQTVVSAVGESGCGYEAPLEAMYRFLVDPEPPVSVGLVSGFTTPGSINQVLLAQRSSFLRPDSAVAVVILSDENDCSIRDDGVGWFVGSSSRMPRATVECDVNVNDPCCRSCAQREFDPPTGCVALMDDNNCKTVPAGQSYATWDAPRDSLNLRCFEQRKRFGFDLLYPIERYSDALSNPKVRNRAQVLVDNPLFAARDGKGPRSATLISVSLIVGAPWQDLATTASLSPGHAIEYLDGAGLESNARWPLLLGNPALNLPPTDPFMTESVAPRSGQNPLTLAAIAPATSTNPQANPINGHEKIGTDLSDLQFACTFALPAPVVCPDAAIGCECAAAKGGDLSFVIADNSPLCQPPGGGPVSNTQYYGRAYPSTRELAVAKLLAERAVPASLCPKSLTDPNGPDFGYVPAFDALLGRVAKTLK